MLRVRLLFAAILIAPLLLVIWADVHLTGHLPGIWIYPLAMAIWLMAAEELRSMIAPAEHRPTRLAALGGTLAVMLGGGAPIFGALGGGLPQNCPLGQFGWAGLAMMACLGLAFATEMVRYRPGECGSAARVAWSVFIATYLGLSLTFMAALRLHGDGAWGMAAVISMIAIVKMSDTGAYAFGRLFGRHKMSPHLSPKKTIEGALGGIGTAIATALVFRYSILAWFTGTSAAAQGGGTAGWVLYGILLAVAAIIGDLSESLLKRDLGCKDSSRWMPGLGGLLDVADSLLLAAPVAYVCWAAGLVGQG